VVGGDAVLIAAVVIIVTLVNRTSIRGYRTLD